MGTKTTRGPGSSSTIELEPTMIEQLNEVTIELLAAEKLRRRIRFDVLSGKPLPRWMCEQADVIVDLYVENQLRTHDDQETL